MDIGTGCREGGFLGAAELEQVQGAFEQLLDFCFARELWGEQAKPKDTVIVAMWDDYLEPA